MQEHRGNGEHPESLERRRQLLLWQSLAALIALGGALGVIRLVRDLFVGEPARLLVYQVVLLVLTALFEVLALTRIRALRRRP
ncbi:MAG TPA: hypothetical protein VGM21_09555 [Actinomycetota bacterium]|jgi:hypothetical protein